MPVSSDDWPTCDYCTERFPDALEKARHVEAKHAQLLEELREMREQLLSQPASVRPELDQLVSLGDAALSFAEAKRGDASDAEVVAVARGRLEELVRRVYPSAVLYVFGSTATGLPEKGSDIDMAADISGQGDWVDSTSQQEAVARVYTSLNRYGFPRGLFRVEETRVPIVSFKPQSKMGLRSQDVALCSSTWDLSFQHNGVRNSHWLRACVVDSPALRVAALWLKAWSKEADINDGRHGKLTSYAFLVMLIFYAVTTGKAPYRNPAGYNTREASPCPAYLGPAGEGVDQKNVGDIIAGFFDFYSSFDFTQYIVSLNTDPALGLVRKAEIGWLIDKPGTRRTGVYYNICIEDPYEELRPTCEGLNLGRKLTEYKACKLRLAFVQAAAAVRELRASDLVRGTGAPARDYSNDVCRSCGNLGHISKDCPQRHAAERCFLCGQLGHIKADCPEKDDYSRTPACFRCGQRSHLARDCPESGSGKGGCCGKATFGKGHKGDDSNRSKGGCSGKYFKGGPGPSSGKTSLVGQPWSQWRSDRGLGGDGYDPDYERGKGGHQIPSYGKGRGQGKKW